MRNGYHCSKKVLSADEEALHLLCHIWRVWRGCLAGSLEDSTVTFNENLATGKQAHKLNEQLRNNSDLYVSCKQKCCCFSRNLIYRPPANELESCFMLVNKKISLSCINDPFYRTGSGSKQERSGIQLMSNLSIRFIAELTFLCARFIYARLFSLIHSLILLVYFDELTSSVHSNKYIYFFWGENDFPEHITIEH